MVKPSISIGTWGVHVQNVSIGMNKVRNKTHVDGVNHIVAYCMDGDYVGSYGIFNWKISNIRRMIYDTKIISLIIMWS